jgi:hypothetical protein
VYLLVLVPLAVWVALAEKVLHRALVSHFDNILDQNILYLNLCLLLVCDQMGRCTLLGYSRHTRIYSNSAGWIGQE